MAGLPDSERTLTANSCDIDSPHVVINIPPALAQGIDDDPTVLDAFSEDEESELHQKLSAFNWKRSMVTVLAAEPGQVAPFQIFLHLSDFVVFTHNDYNTEKDVYLLTFIPRRIPQSCPALRLAPRRPGAEPEQASPPSPAPELMLAVHIEIIIPGNAQRICVLDQLLDVNKTEFRRVREKRRKGDEVDDQSSPDEGARGVSYVKLYRSRTKIEDFGLTLYVFLNTHERLDKVVIKQRKVDFWAMVKSA
eukprot:TRINITY_DN5625_c0_g1_i1.p1 TRINITY_DN5625_c0_g1~~TRINITY_DN5625_c0_g1_i1.p1  ORF type:complete len:264 (-),score=38.89 TRINITY_DN5625_c0_g1_i1:157-903(-)